jgi:uncharacterized protein (DUF1697 family)
VKYVALLRGINVGGKNKLSMKELIELFDVAGCTNVETYIQSGNVVFEASAALAKRVPQIITQTIAERFGYQVPLIVRSAAKLAKVVAANPFLARGAAERELHVYFLADKPTAAELDAKRSAPGEFVLQGQEIYLRLPNGMGRSKLTNAYFDSKLKTVCTARNWATVLQLMAMTNPWPVGIDGCGRRLSEGEIARTKPVGRCRIGLLHIELELAQGAVVGDVFSGLGRHGGAE